MSERADRVEPRLFIGIEHGERPRDVPADHRLAAGGGEDRCGGLGIGPDVVLPQRVDVADAVGRSGHQIGVAELRQERRIALQRRCDVGERSERDEVVLAGFGLGDVEQHGDRILAAGDA